ncbi:hypothetical protein N6L24_06155 [Cognatishimia sp. SS12]|uniref:hypothetical protein n=1 Tax=Cognatishimia sp. SS12 TaxID=2979465 RepID=UPI0023309461|nr:hypothetical protein [Cognatishimia sp. SS12]MDC0737852.1 hypothetical protein [Cognatishimia sp. SS12]
MTDTPDLESQARNYAKDLGDKAKSAISDTVREKTDAAQHQAAAEVQTTADAAHAAADTFDPGSIQAQAAHMVAGHLEDAARRVRTLDIEQTVTDVSGFARRNPLLFLGAAALAGFAATRFLKASEPETQPYATHHHNGGTYGSS